MAAQADRTGLTPRVAAALLAYLSAGRFRSTGRVQHLAMAWAFSVLAAVNLFLSAGPIAVLGSRPVGAVTWVAIGLPLVAIAFCDGSAPGRH